MNEVVTQRRIIMNHITCRESGTSVGALVSDQHSCLDHLSNHKYIRLTTFRRNGVPVSTPVWFAQDGDTVYVTTARASGKVKRIRNNPGVEVAPSNATGKQKGVGFKGIARVLPSEEEGRAAALLQEKYSLVLRLFEGLWRLWGHEHVYLAIQPLPGASGELPPHEA
jgi:uncharacterized protein